MVRALASRHCGPGSIPRLGVICGLSLLLVLFLAPRGFSPGALVFPSPQKPAFPFDLDYCQARYHELLAREIAQALPVLLTLNKSLYHVARKDTILKLIAETWQVKLSSVVKEKLFPHQNHDLLCWGF